MASLTVPANFPIPASEASKYLIAMQKTPSGRSAGPTEAEDMGQLYRHLDFTPPAIVRQNALRGLRLVFEQRKEGGTPIGWGRAVQLALGLPVPPRDLRRMVAYGQRHALHARKVHAIEDQTPAYVAWLLWGGEEGIAWAGWMLQQMLRIRGERRASRPQSLLFPVDSFTIREAKQWLEKHGFKVTSPDTTDRYHRFRQEEPDRFAKLRTIPFGDEGIKAIVGVPARKRANR